jgi:O-antigen/teichoic acid export membrane protein
MTAPEPAPSAASTPMTQEMGLAARNTVKLALSLICTWSVALFVRFQIPRYMGALEFGHFTFADSFAASFLGGLELGVDLYIQKEVSVRPKHASDFIGGLILLRAILAAALVGVMLTILRVTGKSGEVQITACIFGLTYFVTIANTTFGTILQASTRVGRLAITNVVSKVAWGAALVACIWTQRHMEAFATALLASELLRTSMLLPAVRAAVDLEFRVDAGAVRRVFVASLPYFISGVAIVITGRINVSMLEYIANDEREVGWLGAATNIGSLSMVMSPVLTGILLPTLARATARSKDEVYAILRLALEAVLVVAVPVTLLIGIGADIWVRWAFREGYAQSALSLVVVAPQFVFTYTAMTLTSGLVVLDMQWKATRNALLALAMTPAFVLLMVPLLAKVGEGGAAMGAATAVAFSEIVISSLCLYYVGRRAVGRRTIAAIAKSVTVALLVVAVDVLVLRARGMTLNFVRVVIDMALYTALALAVGVIRVREAIDFVRTVRRRDAGAATPTTSPVSP